MAVFVTAISVLFKSSFYMSVVIVTVLGVFGTMVHIPETMPGAINSPEGKEVHPFMAIAIGVLVVLVFLAIGFLLPEIFRYDFSSYS